MAGAPGGHEADGAEREAPNAEQHTPAPESPAEQSQLAPEPSSVDASADEASAAEATPPAPGFGERGRMRRRARFLRKARELAYRDLGGLVFDLHRFGQRNDPLVLAKLATLRQIDTEVRELEAVLDDHRPVTVLREVGIAACPRCAAIHDSDDRFCPGCGLAFDSNAERPIATTPVGAPAPAPAATGPAQVGGASQTPATANTPLSATPSPSTAQTPSPAPDPAPIAPAPVPSDATAATRATTSPPSASPTSPPPRVKPRATPPPVKPTAPPVAARPAPEPGAPQSQEDEPTQIIRPSPSGQ